MTCKTMITIITQHKYITLKQTRKNMNSAQMMGVRGTGEGGRGGEKGGGEGKEEGEKGRKRNAKMRRERTTNKCHVNLLTLHVCLSVGL